MLKVWIINDQRVRRGLGAVVACKAVLRRSGVGTWTMTLDANHHVSQLFDRGWRVSVYDDDTFLFSGPATTITRSFTTNANSLVLEGVTDMCVLEDRLMYADPAVNAGVNSGSAYQTGTGAAGALIVQIVNANAGPAAPLSQRRTDGLAAMPASTAGTSTSLNARWTNALDEVQALARVGGLVVDAGQAASSANIVVAVRAAADLSNRIRFNRKNGLGDHDVTLRAPTVTTAFAAGGGTGTARTIFGLNGPVKWGNRRIERFYDRRDVPQGSTGDLRKTDEEALAEGGESAAVRFDVTETAQYRFGRDFLLGDRLTVQTPTGLATSGALETVELEFNPHGRTVKLTIGENTPANESAPAWVKRVRAMEQAMRRIQGAQ